jgi:hypothetical protein
VGGEGVPPVWSLAGVLAGAEGWAGEAVAWIGRAVVSLVTSVTWVEAGSLDVAGLGAGVAPVTPASGGCGAGGRTAVAAVLVFAAASRAVRALARERPARRDLEWARANLCATVTGWTVSCITIGSPPGAAAEALTAEAAW